MGLKQWIFGRALAGRVEDAKMGKLGAGPKAVWDFANGWKTWLMALVLLAEVLCEGHGCATPLSYVRSGANAAGWGSVAPAFDPGLVAAALGTLLATGHKLVKAIKQYRAGVPLAELNP